MTRLRLELKDRSLVRLEELKKQAGVLGIVEEDTFQVVVGPGRSAKWGAELKDMLASAGAFRREEITSWQEEKKFVKSQQKGRLKAALRLVGDIFVPLIPAIIAAGLLGGIAGYFENLYLAEGFRLADVSIIGLDGIFFLSFFRTLSTSFFSVLAIFVGINAARVFGANMALGGILGALTLSPDIKRYAEAFGLHNAESPLQSILIPGKGGVLGVIFAVFLLAIVERHLHKRIPDALDTILTPTIALIVMGLVTVFVLMPLAGLLSDALLAFLSLLIGQAGLLGLLSGFILATLFLPLVVVGLHHGLIPFYTIQLETEGSIALYPILAMAGAGQVGAALALWLRCPHDNVLRNTIRAALPVGILGIGEPLIYGVTLPRGRAFLTACLGGGFGGMIMVAFSVRSMAFGPSGITALPIIVPSSMLYYILGLLVSYLGGFILTFLWGYQDSHELH
ncbi:unnamed protein product [Darwinula stevensoni]|uniref:Uncharacterized protein n=1 Tax=Darwinula stevensoni TaxID=69355 RepID=A0A7R9A6E7_9CRUS|nr:unnamed protein product [Darwinula stevensoni]CAG0888946.1 unnamed protein product [Darwinula stevensoni]